MPTWRLFAALLLAAPFAALGSPFILVAVAIALVAVLAAVTDWLLAADGRRIHVTRELPSDKLSLGAWNQVLLRLHNPTARQQRITLREQPPADFELDPRGLIFEVALAPHSEETLTYHVRPPRRGDASFGDLYLRVDGPLRLVRRAFRQRESAQPVRVYPNLRELRRYDLLVRRGLETQSAGRPVRVAGASTEFERIRDYLPDDDFRRINWKATARRGQPLVNQFGAERSQNLVILLDAGRAMAALAETPASAGASASAGRARAGPSAAAAASTSAHPAALASAAEDDADAPPAASLALTKLDRALNTALLLAYVASQRGDRVSLLAYADDVRAFVPPQRGRRALLSTVQTLYNLRAEPVEPDHARAFAFLAQRNLRRSLVVLFTDLLDRESSSALAAHVLRAARQHMVVCVTLADPNLRRPAERQARNARDLYEKMVAQRLLDDRAEVLATFAAHGVLMLDTDAETLNPKLIATYLELKQRGRI